MTSVSGFSEELDQLEQSAWSLRRELDRPLLDDWMQELCIDIWNLKRVGRLGAHEKANGEVHQRSKTERMNSKNAKRRAGLVISKHTQRDPRYRCEQ